MQLETYNKLKPRCLLFNTVLLKAKEFSTDVLVCCDSLDPLRITLKTKNHHSVLGVNPDVLNSFILLDSNFIGDVIIERVDDGVVCSVDSYKSCKQCLKNLVRTPVCAFRINEREFNGIDKFVVRVGSGTEVFEGADLNDVRHVIELTSLVVNIVDITHDEQYIIDHFSVNRLDGVGAIQMNAGFNVPKISTELGKIHLNMEDVGDVLRVASVILSWNGSDWV